MRRHHALRVLRKTLELRNAVPKTWIGWISESQFLNFPACIRAGFWCSIIFPPLEISVAQAWNCSVLNFFSWSFRFWRLGSIPKPWVYRVYRVSSDITSIISLLYYIYNYHSNIIWYYHYYHFTTTIIYIYYYIVVYLCYIYIIIIYILYYHFCHFPSMAPLINCPHPEAWNRRQSPKLCDRPFLGAHSKNIRRRPEKKPCRYFPRYFNFFPNIYLGKIIANHRDHDIFSDHTCDFYMWFLLSDEKCGVRRTFLEFPFWGSHDGFAQAVHSTLRRRWVCWLLISQAFGCL